MQANSLEHESVSMMISGEKFKEIKAGKGIDMNFNPMKIIGSKILWNVVRIEKKLLNCCRNDRFIWITIY